MFLPADLEITTKAEPIEISMTLLTKNIILDIEILEFVPENMGMNTKMETSQDIEGRVTTVDIQTEADITVITLEVIEIDTERGAMKGSVVIISITEKKVPKPYKQAIEKIQKVRNERV